MTHDSYETQFMTQNNLFTINRTTESYSSSIRVHVTICNGSTNGTATTDRYRTGARSVLSLSGFDCAGTVPVRNECRPHVVQVPLIIQFLHSGTRTMYGTYRARF
jgi:hypothetical protein